MSLLDSQEDEAYQNFILAQVSRTFALTIPQLPPPLYQVVGNAYLLCRIADTIEDEPALSCQQKTEFAAHFVQATAGEQDANELSHRLLPLLSSASSASEKDLIAHLPQVIRLLRHFTPAQQTAVLRCLQIMSTGMAEFQRHKSRCGLKSTQELDRYCYHVAGVVGEMLTDLFCDHLPVLAPQKERLRQLAISFGQGLQMTNILKDLWEDWQRGACWLPQDIFTPHGFALQDLDPQHYYPAFGEGLAQLITIACNHLSLALEYVLLIPPTEKGIRRFCLWALAMAVLTLRRIDQRRDFTSGKQVKISRRSVKIIILASNVLTSQDEALRFLFKRFTRCLTNHAPTSFSFSPLNFF